MLNIEIKSNGTDLAIALTGRLDTTAAPETEAAIKQCR